MTPAPLRRIGFLTFLRSRFVGTGTGANVLAASRDLARAAGPIDTTGWEILQWGGRPDHRSLTAYELPADWSDETDGTRPDVSSLIRLRPLVCVIGPVPEAEIARRKREAARAAVAERMDTYFASASGPDERITAFWLRRIEGTTGVPHGLTADVLNRIQRRRLAVHVDRWRITDAGQHFLWTHGPDE